jgi:hypothetical protein
VKVGVHLRIGIGEIDDTPGRHLELTHEGAWWNGGLIDLLDLHVGADILPELLQHLPVGAAARGCGDEHLELDRLAVILDQRLGLLDVVGQRAVILARDPGAVAIGLRAGRDRPLVAACGDFLRSSAMTSGWRTRTSSNGGVLVLKA